MKKKRNTNAPVQEKFELMLLKWLEDWKREKRLSSRDFNAYLLSEHDDMPPSAVCRVNRYH